MDKILIQKLFGDIYSTFPDGKNGEKYLRMKSGKKLYFGLFIKKYGLRGGSTKYSQKDILRRIRLSEFFGYIVRDNDMGEIEDNRFVIETYFFRMVIVETKKKKLELLSFYNYR